MGNIPEPGQFYRDLQGRLYQILTRAVSGETGEKMAVYQALYGSFPVFVSPLSRFGEPGETETAAFYRTQLPESPEGLKQDRENQKEDQKAGGSDPEAGPNPLFLRFLEAEDLDGRLAALGQMRGKITQQDLDGIYFSLDMSPIEGTADHQLHQIIRSLETRKKFDGRRLR